MSRLCGILLIGLTAVCVFFTGCTKPKDAEVQGPSLIIGFENDVASLDPIKVQDTYISRILGQMYEGLIQLNGKNELEPLLAESWTHNAAADIWRFKMRKGVLFHESPMFGSAKAREVTADDVVYSFNRALSKDSLVGFVLEGVIKGFEDYQSGKTPALSGIRAISPSEVEIELVAPDPLFVNRLTSVILAIVPKEVASLPKDEFGSKMAVGTGPFLLFRRTDSEVVLRKNPSYWRAVRGNVSEIRFPIIKNDQVRLTELRNGKLNFMRLPQSLANGVAVADPEAPNGVKLKPEWQSFDLKIFQTFNSALIGFNCQRLSLSLRRAFTFGVNRKEIVSLFLPGTVDLAVGTVPLAFPGYEPVTRGDIFDLQKAKAELAAGGPDVVRPIELLVNEKESSEEIGQLLVAQMAKVGIPIKLVKISYDNVLARMDSGDFDALFMSFEYVYSTPGPILDALFNSKRIPSPNFMHYKNPAVDANLAKFEGLTDTAAADRLTREIERQLIEDPPAAFLFQSKTVIACRKGITGVQVNGHGVPLLWEVSVE
jgi:oligopeptide transport system substrate-binding protein